MNVPKIYITPNLTNGYCSSMTPLHELELPILHNMN
jgi:hypothetical protein